jgi:hypothetical protein
MVVLTPALPGKSNPYAVAVPCTVTVTDFVSVPPGPAQVKVKVLDAVSAPLDCEPDVALFPDHDPEAVHELALVDAQVNVDEPPLITVVGFALSATVGAGGAASTVTVTECVTVPPGPVHVSEKSLREASRGPVVAAPDSGLEPVQLLLAGDAVALQLEALFAAHVSVEAIPLATDAGFASKDTTGGDGDATTTVTDLAT